MKGRQLREAKEQQQRAARALCACPKRDLERRAQVERDVEREAADLRARHAAERAAALAAAQDAEAAPAPAAPPPAAVQRKRDKRQRERGQRAAEALAHEQDVQRARDAATAAGPSAAEAESAALDAALAPLGLAVKEVAADGNCLFNALADQLGKAQTPQRLREAAADYIWEHEADFEGFVEVAGGGGSGRAAVHEHCERLRRPGTWGGQLELVALADALGRPIHVHAADGAVQVHGERFAAPPLRVSFHRHAFALGEHYNSVVPRLHAAP
eukprot:TRINITY_DN8818_c0_g1_i1.p2 TRINITY_DN8818_c0_g1~~TRINITY_DN8818_c0_g1_i1.p2  ORF type:complete len:284 (-),score=106.28 TRINITY_DN8818_c0_g1_i1:79-894(-)